MAKYGKLKLAELKKLADERGIDATRLKHKQHFVDALHDADLNPATEEPEKKSSPKPVREKPQSSTKISDYGLEAAIDYGTWKLVFTYVFTCRGERIELPAPLLFAGSSAEVRMIAAFIGDEFVHGPELEKRANNDSSISDKVMSSFKLALYPDAKTSPITKSIEDILEECGKTLDDLLFEHMRANRRDIEAALKATTFQIQFTDAEFADLFDRAHIRVTVPQMWGPNARRRMQAAAKKAGMKVVVLSSEPHCALAYLIHKEAQKKIDPARQLRKLDSVLVVDIGCGTADFAMLELQDDLGASSTFESIGHSSGDLCGSGMVDEHLFKALVARKGRAWYVKSFQALGVTERDFRRRALIAIERIKSSFDPARSNGIDLIHGIDVAHVVIDITRAEYEAAMNTVIAEIKKHIDVFVKMRTPTVIEVTGGFSRSQYLMDALKSCYEPRDIMVICPNEGVIGQCFPVAMGALLRYDSISPQVLPAQRGYALSITEPFVPRIHEDACTIEYDWESEEEIVTKKPCVLSSFYDGEVDIVEHRIHNIVNLGDTIEPGRVIRQEFQLAYRIPWENPRISADFVLTEKKLEDHAPAKDYDPVTETYKFCTGVQEWASVEIPIPRQQLQAKGFKTLVAHNEHFWLVQARVIVQYQGEDFQIGFEILKPLTEGGEDSNGEVAFRVKDTVWEAEHSEFLE